MEQPDKLISLIKDFKSYAQGLYLNQNGKVGYKMNNLQVADQDQYQSNYFNIQFIDHVAHVKLNRPEKRNAMNWDFWRDLPRIIGDIDRNSSARCIDLSSTGPIFSDGMDLSIFGQDVN